MFHSWIGWIQTLFLAWFPSNHQHVADWSSTPQHIVLEQHPKGSAKELLGLAGKSRYSQMVYVCLCSRDKSVPHRLPIVFPIIFPIFSQCHCKFSANSNRGNDDQPSIIGVNGTGCHLSGIIQEIHVGLAVCLGQRTPEFPSQIF